MVKIDALLQFELTVITLKVKSFFNILSKSPWFTKIFPFHHQKYLFQLFSCRFISGVARTHFQKLLIGFRSLNIYNSVQFKYNVKTKY